jgi:eukaryotic-like serine/threonine-protein kinase
MSDESERAVERLLRRVAETSGPAIPRGVRPGVTLAGRFEIGQKLGAGGMGQVFAAFDRVRQTRVAVKVLGRLTPRSIGELKREFRAASELVHPNLVRLHQLFCDDVEWLFSMDLVEGVTLQELMRTSGGEGIELLCHVFRQLALALTHLHQAGTLHGDLKPSNFLITSEERRVVLLDFGLARPIGLAQARDFGGTPGYMAPEQALDEKLAEAADWYSFGVVLYEALSGVLPFRNPLESRLAHAPAELRDLTLRLLRIQPDRRPSGHEVLRCLAVPTMASQLSALPPPSRGFLIGRDAETAALEASFQVARSGTPAIALVSGPSGIGKTMLVERFVQAACARGAQLLTSRCRERESMGYKAADGIIDDIVKLLDELDEIEAEALIPDGIEELTVLFPALNLARAIERTPKSGLAGSDQAAVRLRAVTAFQELVSRISKQAPLILWMDDLQWSDAESAVLVGPLLRAQHAMPILLVGTYRDSMAGRGPLLDALFEGDAASLPRPTELHLAPLTPEAAERLALEFLPSDAPEVRAIAGNIVREARGHPMFIAELAHAAASSGESPERRPHSTLVDLVLTRIANLPTNARGILELTAIAGVPLARSVLRQTRGIDPAETERAIDVLRASRLARSHGPNEEDAVDTHHDRIREIVVQQLGEPERRAHHLALVHVLERDPKTNPDLLAVQYQGSGDLPRAGQLWIVAADHALRALAFEHAADLYDRGLALAVLDAAERHRLQIRRAEALAYAGRGPASADGYLRVSVTSARDESLELRRLAAEQLLLSGHIEQGLRTIQGVLESVGMHATGGPRDLLAALTGRVRVRLRGLRYDVRPESELSRDELVRLDASWTLASSLSMIDPIRGSTFQSQHLLLALQAGEPRRLLRALSLEASYAATPGLGSEQRTAHVLAVADELVQNNSDSAALGLLALARGIAAYLGGRLESALTHFEEALALLDRSVGTVWETLSVQRFTIAVLFFLGRFRRLRDFSTPLLTTAEGTGNLYATLCFRTSYSTLAWLVGDRVDEVRRQLDRARDDWRQAGNAPLFQCNLLMGETFLDLYKDDAESALARLRDQWHELEEAQLLRIGVLRVQMWHLRAAAATRAADVIAARGQSSRAAELRREARKIAARAQGDRIKRAGPLFDLVEAALDWSEGDVRRAQKRLRRSVGIFDDLGMRLFAAAARVRLGESFPDGSGGALAERGYEVFQSEGVVNPARMLNLLAPGFGASGGVRK